MIRIEANIARDGQLGQYQQEIPEAVHINETQTKDNTESTNHKRSRNLLITQARTESVYCERILSFHYSI